MKISYNWLSEFVELTETPQKIAEQLGDLGFEVSSLTILGGKAENVVVAKILEISPHPNADKLSLCRVSTDQEVLSIVCGAKNVSPGQTVPLAKVGAVLPDGKRIEKAVIRGTESFGMLCSGKELGLSDDRSGILILEEGTPLGAPLEKILPLSDTIFEVEVPPNRPDCLSHLGIARELSAAWGKPLKTQSLEEIEAKQKMPLAEIIDVQACTRYIGAAMIDVKIAPSPLWLARRLTLCGIRPINNIVDITNYVLLEWGQPLHAFDFEKLAGTRIVVRRAKTDERILALDGNLYSLGADILVIADEQQPVAIAGIIGGAATAIGNQTKTILIEAASFDKNLIRRTSKNLGIHTESSYRFERGIHPQLAEWASKRATQLIKNLAGGG